jgi:hypothetical protein
LKGATLYPWLVNILQRAVTTVLFPEPDEVP